MIAVVVMIAAAVKAVAVKVVVVVAAAAAKSRNRPLRVARALHLQMLNLRLPWWSEVMLQLYVWWGLLYLGSWDCCFKLAHVAVPNKPCSKCGQRGYEWSDGHEKDVWPCWRATQMEFGKVIFLVFYFLANLLPLHTKADAPVHPPTATNLRWSKAWKGRVCLLWNTWETSLKSFPSRLRCSAWKKQIIEDINLNISYFCKQLFQPLPKSHETYSCPWKFTVRIARSLDIADWAFARCAKNSYEFQTTSFLRVS